MMLNLFGKTLSQLQQLCNELDLPRYTARQICDWIYKKRIVSIDDMTNLSLVTRSKLSANVTLSHTHPTTCQRSKDGTRKYLYVDAADSSLHPIEAVYIPDADRATLCVSCQRGCKMGCRFCVTGKQGFHGNLESGDIMSQIFGIDESNQLTNVVFMGMGEPMDNLDSVMAATEILTSDWGLGWSPKRITVSSVGIAPALRRFLNESRCHLAISLHNPFPDERQAIMPMEKVYPISDIIGMLHQYDWTGQRRVSFEYIMFEGLNDTIRHADGLLRLLRGLPCRINLIRFHTSPNMPFRTSSDHTIQVFRDYLNGNGITCTLRASRGEDIMAACGLLAGMQKNKW